MAMDFSMWRPNPGPTDMPSMPGQSQMSPMEQELYNRMKGASAGSPRVGLPMGEQAGGALRGGMPPQFPGQGMTNGKAAPPPFTGMMPPGRTVVPQPEPTFTPPTNGSPLDDMAALVTRPRGTMPRSRGFGVTRA